MPRPKLKDPLGPSTPIRFGSAQDAELETAAKKTGLSKADIVRQAVKFGLDPLLEALTTPPKRKAA